MADIIVGVDGSTGSIRALAWAIEEGALRNCTVRAVYAVGRDEVTWTERLKVGSETRTAFEVNGEKHLDEALATIPSAGVVKEVVLSTHMTTAEELVERSHNATMLVVGSRGLGGFTGLLLGSVSHQVLQHARCPVVVVPMHTHPSD